MNEIETYDLLVVGGGINGCGIARDAAGRGLKVALVEMRDLAHATSSASTKMIHGGLRYLEYYEFRLVREALAEREVLLAMAPHIIWPIRIAIPHAPWLRPFWLVRTGLFLYDHLSRRLTLPGTETIDIAASPLGVGLKPEFTRGLVYSDCWVDDARLVVLNAMDAAARGATVMTRTALVSARRAGDRWIAELQGEGGAAPRRIAARGLVNASGAWVRDVLVKAIGRNDGPGVRLVKGSHVVVPRLYEGGHGYLLQNEDRRVIFLLPYEDDFTLVGTTDIQIDGPPGPVDCGDDEAAYLCEAASRFLTKPVSAADVVWRYSGVRPLYDDGASDPSAVTRDYVIEVDDADGALPLLDVYGGKITTYRRLAEEALGKLDRYFPDMRGAWTGSVALPGGDVGKFDDFLADLRRRYPALPAATLGKLARRHGSNALRILEGVATAADLGQDFGATLTAREIDWMIEREWATSSRGVLWRRSKAGLHMTPAQREAVSAYVEARLRSKR
jgi:glycerol-3-phosphate dehydrogenase